MGVASEHDADEPAVSRLLQELAQLNQDLSVPSPRAYGIDERRWQELLPVMAGQALASGSPANNPHSERIRDRGPLSAGLGLRAGLAIVGEHQETALVCQAASSGHIRQHRIF